MPNAKKTNYRTALFESYDRRGDLLDAGDDAKLSWFSNYTSRYYLPRLANFDRKKAKILDVGCNKGYLLTALHQFGFKNLTGIDLAAPEIEKAKKLLPEAHFIAGDVFKLLEEKPNSYDIIIIKAVLEHIPKAEIIPFLIKLKQGLRKNGVLIIDVPNMDWLFVGHERYVDFTHEVGFTKESLQQVMGEVFDSTSIHLADNIIYPSPLVILKKNIARFILGTLLKWADPEGGSNPIWARSLIAVGQKS